MNTNLGQFVHGLPNPPADAPQYVKDLHRALVQMAGKLAARDDAVIPYTGTASQVLTSDVTGTQAGNVKWSPTGWVVLAPAFSATQTVDISAYPTLVVVINITVTANITFDITGGVDGQVIRLWLTSTGGPWTFTAGTHLEAATGTGSVPFPASLTASKTDTLGFQWRSAQAKALIVATVPGFA